MSTSVAVRDAITDVAVSRPSMIRPIAAPAEVLKVQEETRELVTAILKEGRDYGVIPGTDKPSMLKPGAERTALAFGCYYGEPEIIEREIDHDRVVQWIKTKWVEKPKPENHQELKAQGVGRNKKFGERWAWQEKTEEQGTSLGLYRYVVRVPVIQRETGVVVGYGIGSCSTMESKYIDRPRDSENTALKMAHKRGIVAACLITFGLSDQFTQDVEDLPHLNGEGDSAPSNEPEAKCPKCGSRMWDNRAGKTNPKAPDFKCRDRNCDGVYWPGQWPPKPAEESAADAAPDSDGAALATTDQKRRITELLNDVALDLDLDTMEKVARKAGAADFTEDAATRAIAWLEGLRAPEQVAP